MMAVGPSDQINKHNLVSLQKGPVVFPDSVRNQVKQPAVIAGFSHKHAGPEQFPEPDDSALHLPDVTHGQTGINVPHGVDHARDPLIALAAFLPEIHDHIGLSIPEEGSGRCHQFRDSEAFRVVMNPAGQLPVCPGDGEHSLHSDTASRHAFQNLQHVHENEVVRRVFAVERDKQIDLPAAFAASNGLRNGHHIVDLLSRF